LTANISLAAHAADEIYNSVKAFDFLTIYLSYFAV